MNQNSRYIRPLFIGKNEITARLSRKHEEPVFYGNYERDNCISRLTVDQNRERVEYFVVLLLSFS